jgi:hypothetical protein
VGWEGGGVKHETRTMHLFAGHGGGLLADLILGHQPVVAVEWDGYACQVLRERAADGWFPSLRVWEGDVQLFDPSEYIGIVDIIHAGFPCQDISVAGKQAGVSDGTRSGLYREVLRIAGVVRPKQLFLENVSAILSNGLGTVLGDLASLGYDTRWLCIRASDVGAPHHRDRWFLLATYADELRPRTGAPSQTRKTFSDQHGDGSQEKRGRVELNAWPCGLCADVAYANGPYSQGGGRQMIRKDGKSRMDMLDWAVEKDGGRLNPQWVEHLMGFPIGFTVLKDWVTRKSRSKPPQLTDFLGDSDAP